MAQLSQNTEETLLQDQAALFGKEVGEQAATFGEIVKLFVSNISWKMPSYPYSERQTCYKQPQLAPTDKHLTSSRDAEKVRVEVENCNYVHVESYESSETMGI